MICVESDPQLFEVICALAPPGGFPRSLNCRQEQSDQNANNRNNNEKFDQCEPTSAKNKIPTTHGSTSLERHPVSPISPATKRTAAWRRHILPQLMDISFFLEETTDDTKTDNQTCHQNSAISRGRRLFFANRTPTLKITS